MSEKPHAADHEVLSDLLPDAGGIQLIPRYDERITHPNCLIIDPCPGSENDPRIMATVEHYSEKKDATGFPWTIVKVIEEPLSLQAAALIALKYAKANKVPVIFLNQYEFSTDAEKEQTDTTVLDTAVVRKLARMFKRRARSDGTPLKPT